jgi:hypothetical protein
MNAAGQLTIRSSTRSLCVSLLRAARVMLSYPRFWPTPLSCPVVFISLLFIANIGPVPNGALFSRQHSAYAAGRSTICQNGCHAEVSECCYNDSANAASDCHRSCAMPASCWDRVPSARARTDADHREAACAMNEDYGPARNRRTSRSACTSCRKY